MLSSRIVNRANKESTSAADSELIISINLESHFTLELAQLRNAGFTAEQSLLEDPFDKHSQFIVLRERQKAIGAVRIGSSQHSALQYWSKQQFPLEASPTTAELTRGVVAKAYQGHGLFRLLILKTLLSLPSLGFQQANAAAEPYMLRFYQEFGFEPIGKLQPFSIRGWTPMVQPIQITLTEELIANLSAKYQQHVKHLAQNRISRIADISSNQFIK